MKPIQFPQTNNTEGNIPFFYDHINATVITLWELTDEELAVITEKKAIFVVQGQHKVSFPEVSINFRQVTEEEKEKLNVLAKRERVAKARAKRNNKKNKP